MFKQSGPVSLPNKFESERLSTFFQKIKLGFIDYLKVLSIFNLISWKQGVKRGRLDLAGTKKDTPMYHILSFGCSQFFKWIFTRKKLKSIYFETFLKFRFTATF